MGLPFFDFSYFDLWKPLMNSLPHLHQSFFGRMPFGGPAGWREGCSGLLPASGFNAFL